MKIAILGSGSQGTGLAGLLAMEPDVEKIVFCDLYDDAAQKAAETIRTLGDKLLCRDIVTRHADASDPDSVAMAVEDCDICFHSPVQPGNDLTVMEGCLKGKCHYLDLFGTPEVVLKQLEMSEQFREAGLTALPSIGMSPGWTSLAAQKVIDELDEVNDVIIRWADWMDTEEFIAPISAFALMEEWFGQPLRTVNGNVEDVDLIESKERFKFPLGIGEKDIYTVCTHPDIILIPKFAGKPVNICEEKGGWYLGRMTMEEIWAKQLNYACRQQGEEASMLNIMEACGDAAILPTEYGRLYDEGKISGHVVCFSTEVNGYKDGGFVRYIQYYTSTLEEAQKHLPWASPAVYGTIGGMPIELVLMIGRGEIKERGVFSIGELGIADVLNKAMAARGQILTEEIIRPSGL